MPEYKTSDIWQLEQKIIHPASLFPKPIICPSKEGPEEARRAQMQQKAGGNKYKH